MSFPIGKLWALYVPNVTLFGVELNPGPFTIKEHVLITIMAGVANDPAYAVRNTSTNLSISYVVIRPTLLLSRGSSTTRVPALFVRCRRSALQEFGLKLFYIIDQWLLVISTQLIGFSIGGICKRFLVDPPSMIWPGYLVLTSLFNTMHSLETTGTQGLGGVSRRRFFVYIFVGYFFYSRLSPFLLACLLLLNPPPLDFFPNYLFTALSSFSWVCWIAPNNVKLNQLFGITHGLAMGVITFDWGQITSFHGSPLANPWWSAANAGIALLFFTWFLVPILYVSDKNYLFLSLLFFVHLPTVHQHLVQRFLTHGLLKVI